jgi:hypothetical protein
VEPAQLGQREEMTEEQIAQRKLVIEETVRAEVMQTICNHADDMQSHALYGELADKFWLVSLSVVVAPPLRNCLITPALQWHSRGELAYLTG